MRVLRVRGHRGPVIAIPEVTVIRERRSGLPVQSRTVREFPPVRDLTLCVCEGPLALDFVLREAASEFVAVAEFGLSATVLFVFLPKPFEGCAALEFHLPFTLGLALQELALELGAVCICRDRRESQEDDEG